MTSRIIRFDYLTLWTESDVAVLKKKNRLSNRVCNDSEFRGSHGWPSVILRHVLPSGHVRDIILDLSQGPR